jgi:hypothetical protein
MVPMPSDRVRCRHDQVLSSGPAVTFLRAQLRMSVNQSTVFQLVINGGRNQVTSRDPYATLGTVRDPAVGMCVQRLSFTLLA